MVATTGTAYAVLNSTVFVVAVVALFFGTILTTYTMCVNEGSCPKFLPTISDTWVTPPGNYISRIAVSVGAVSLQFANVLIYHISSNLRDTTKKYPGEGFLLGMSMFGTFLLSWVGAICDDNKPGCDGNGTIHTTCAIGFFGLYAIYLILIYNVPTKAGSRVVGRCSGNVLLLLSVLAKFRFVPGFASRVQSWGATDDFTAIIEWLDVAINMLCVAKYFYLNAGGYQLAVVSTPAPASSSKLSIASATGRQTQILTQITSDAIAVVAMVVGFSTVAASWALSVSEGIVPKGQLPDINETFTHRPNNWFGRWGIVLTSTCLSGVTLINHYILSTAAGTKVYAGSWVRLVQFLCAVVGVCSLSVMGAVNLTENKTLHGNAALVFFFGYLAYMVFATADEFIRNGSCCHRGLLMSVLLAVSTVSKLRFHCVRACLGRSLPERVLDLSPNGVVAASDVPFEWVDIACITVFLAATVFLRPQAAGKRFGIAVVRSE